MEEEHSDILRTMARLRRDRNLVDLIRGRFSVFGGIELDLPPRDPLRCPPNFEE
jgi:antitoxin FitA